MGQDAQDTIVVAQDGSGDYTTVQAAVDAVPEDKPNITVRGSTGAAEDVVITYDNSAGSAGSRSGSASVTILADDFRADDLTFENSFEEVPDGEGNQAVAVRAVGDRAIFENVRFLGNQDTLLLDSPSTSEVSRKYLHDCAVEGDADFIVGRGTAVFENRVNTSLANPYGFLFQDRTLDTDSAADQIVYLGRPWRDARLREYQNTGPGAGVNDNRPQLTEDEAATYTKQNYLAGSDGWSPAGMP